MQDEHKQFGEMFAEYDSRRRGKLRRPDLRRMLSHALGEVSEQEEGYLWAMLDVNDDGVVTVEEFKGALREVQDVADNAREDHEHAIEEERMLVLNQLSTELVQRKVRPPLPPNTHTHTPHTHTHTHTLTRARARP
jgi:hypothetical protein